MKLIFSILCFLCGIIVMIGSISDEESSDFDSFAIGGWFGLGIALLLTIH